MKHSKIISTFGLITVLLTVTACGKVETGNKDVVKEPDKTITIIDKEKEVEEDKTAFVTVDKIDRYENINISDWLDDETVIVSKDNETLDKMTMLEFENAYPKSLYLYNLSTKEYKLLQEQKNTNLSDGTLSADKKHLLFTEFTFGDPAYYVMNLESSKVFGITDESIASAMSAKWATNQVVGAAYSGDAYLANVDGKIQVIEGLEAEGLYIVDKIKDNIYYNTGYDQSLMLFQSTTKETTALDLPNVTDVIASPDENQMLILQNNGSKSILLLSNIDGSDQKMIAEGTEIQGISWSEDQSMVAYNLKADSGTTKGLYIYNMLTGNALQIGVDIESSVTTFSPTGNMLSVSAWNGSQWDSSIIYLK